MRLSLVEFVMRYTYHKQRYHSPLGMRAQESAVLIDIREIDTNQARTLLTQTMNKPHRILGKRNPVLKDGM